MGGSWRFVTDLVGLRRSRWKNFFAPLPDQFQFSGQNFRLEMLGGGGLLHGVLITLRSISRSSVHET
jgi:hypothetical protein